MAILVAQITILAVHFMLDTYTMYGLLVVLQAISTSLSDHILAKAVILMTCSLGFFFLSMRWLVGPVSGDS